MRVEQLWRFPIKSMPGECVERVEIGEHGIVGDRCFALRDRETGNVLTARREPTLLLHDSLGSRDAGELSVRPGQPDEPSSWLGRPDELSTWLGRPVELISAEGQGPSTYENPMDPFGETDWFSWQGPAGSFHDSGRNQVSLVSTTTLRDWDLRRFRINVICDGNGEDALVGRRIAVGTAVLDVVKPIERCVMVTRPQVGGIERDLSILRTIHTERGGLLGVASVVVEPGAIAVGDEIQPIG